MYRVQREMSTGNEEKLQKFFKILSHKKEKPSQNIGMTRNMLVWDEIDIAESLNDLFSWYLWKKSKVIS